LREGKTKKRKAMQGEERGRDRDDEEILHLTSIILGGSELPVSANRSLFVSI
jgi:hypothetical protein